VKPSALSIVLAFALVACGGSQPPAQSPEPATAPATDPEQPTVRVVGPPEVAWADMTFEQRGDYMKEVVTPRMQELFAAHDAERFAKVNCMTCHGEGALEGKFDMPNPEIASLPGNPEGFQALMETDPAMMEFMATQVKPTMAELLDIPEYDFTTGEGEFGCMACHAMQ
jgi:mono/diheme cytochrome c family protein